MKKKTKYIYAKRGWLYIAIRIPSPKKPGATKLKLVATNLPVGQEAEAEAMRAQTQDRFNARKDAGFADGKITVAAFIAEKFIPGRKTSSTWKDDEQRLRDFIVPTIGPMPIEDVRARHLLDLFRTLTAATKKPAVVGAGESPRLLAPRTVLNIYAVTRSLFREAKVMDLISTQPCDIPPKYLPKRRDKDASWRGTALFRRSEMKRLLTDEGIDVEHRITNAIFFLGGMRIGEVAALRWKAVSFARRPLGKILVAYAVTEGGDIGPTKTEMPREMPMHPTLRKLLLRWKKEGWAKAMGQAPTPDDFVVPVLPKAAANFGRGPRRPVGGHRTQSVIYKDWTRNLEVLGLRHRRDHDMRRTLITLAQEDGASEQVLEACTHTPDQQKAIDLYNSISWKRKCKHVARLNFKLPKAPTASEAKLQLIAAGAEPFHPDFTRPENPESNQGDDNWRRRESNPPQASRKNSPGLSSVAPDSRSLRVLSGNPQPSTGLPQNPAPDSGEKGEFADLIAVADWLRKRRRNREPTPSAVVKARLQKLSPAVHAHPEAGPAIKLAIDALEHLEFSAGASSMKVVDFLVSAAVRRLGNG